MTGMEFNDIHSDHEYWIATAEGEVRVRVAGLIGLEGHWLCVGPNGEDIICDSANFLRAADPE